MLDEEYGLSITTADDVAFLNVPPTYEEVMGVYQTSVKGPGQQQAPDLPPLAYIDIMPRCLGKGNIRNKVKPKFESFSSIMDGANRWLQDNPGYRVWKCESIERKLDSAADGTLTYELSEMLHHESIFGFKVHIRGIRLWLTKSNMPGSPPQELAVRNETPSKVSIQLPIRGHYRQGGEAVEDEAMYLSYGGFGMFGGMFNTYCGLQKTVAHINKRLATNPIPGSILTIETDTVKAYEGFSEDLDPEATCTSEDKDRFRRFTQLIRIFYVKGPTLNEEIGLKDFEPDKTDAGDIMRPPKFEPFENTVEQINYWLPKQQGIRVVNIQQYDAKVDGILGKYEISSDSTDETVSFVKARHSVRILRVFYVKSKSHASPSQNTYVTSRVFLPAKIGKKSFENMIQTMDRVDAWLRVTGLPIYGVETIKFLFSEYSKQGADVHKSDYHQHGSSSNHWLSAIRVYFPCSFTEPDPSHLPPPPTIEKGSKSCIVM